MLYIKKLRKNIKITIKSVKNTYAQINIGAVTFNT